MKSIDLNWHDGAIRKFLYRDTRADTGVLQQIFKDQDYRLTRLRRGEELIALDQSLERPLILDAGANIGASVCYFALKFPNSHIVAIEPDADNFELLQRNTEGLDVDARRAAIGAREGRVRIVDPGQGEWAYRTAPAADGAIPLIAASQIVAEKVAQGYQPFIAKIDIEGGEQALFEPPTDWVDLFPLLIIELHDWLLPGQGTSLPFLQCIAARNRDFVHIAENIFSIRNG